MADATTPVVPDPNDPGVQADIKRAAILDLFENMDADQALRLHSIMVAVPFGYRAPTWLDWTKHIVKDPDGWAFNNDPSYGWMYVNSTPNPVTEHVTPRAVAMLLADARHNHEGISTKYPWITPNDIVATAIWAREVGYWPGKVLNR